MWKWIYSLVETVVWSTLYANYEYWEVDINAIDNDKATVTLQHSLYMFTSISTRLKYNLSACQGALEDMLAAMYRQIAVI